MIAKTNFCYILVLLSAFTLAVVRCNWPVNQSRRVLSENSCDGPPIKECPEGEEAYFRAYPDVAKNWKRTAHHHWKSRGKSEGKHYICWCPKSEDNFARKLKQQKNGDFVVVAIFKNEAMNFAGLFYFIQVYISYYLLQHHRVDFTLPLAGSIAFLFG